MKYRVRTWINYIAKILEDRFFKISNIVVTQSIISINKIIIEYTLDYIKQIKLDTMILVGLNQIWFYEKLYLLYKLVRMNRDQ